MEPGFRRHGPDGPGGNIRCVYGEHLHAAAEQQRECAEEIALVYVAAHRLDVSSGTTDSDGVDVRGVQLEPRDTHCKGGGHCPGSTAEVQHHTGLRSTSGLEKYCGLVHQQFGS